MQAMAEGGYRDEGPRTGRIQSAGSFFRRFVRRGLMNGIRIKTNIFLEAYELNFFQPFKFMIIFQTPLK